MSTPWLFAWRVALFLAPVGLAVAALEAALWRLGETVPISAIVVESHRDEALFGRELLSQRFDVLKWEAWSRRRPAVVALGSSRVMQIRGALFEQPFLNAGGLIQDVADVQRVADALVAGELPIPRLLLLGVDPWWFSSGTTVRGWTGSRSDDAWSFAAHVSAWRALLGALPLPTGAFAESRAYGLRARRLGDGERLSDGSHQYASLLADFARDPVYRDRESPPMIDRLRGGTHQFAAGTLDAARVDRFRAALTALAGLPDCSVALLHPPVSSDVGESLRTQPAVGPWWTAAIRAVDGVAASLDVPVSGPHVPGDLGFDDRAMFDGVHAGEPLAAAQVLRVARVLDRPDVASPTRIEARIASAASPLSFDPLPDPR